MRIKTKSKVRGTYGYFDESQREYAISKPLPPRPWINYLSNNRMGCFISQGAGGVAWYKQPVTQRISRYQFMALPEDRPGFYVYVREADGTYWNPSFQPCQTKLNRWECRHGMGYTRFTAERRKLAAELKYFVPVQDDVMLWDLTLENRRDQPESVFVTNYIDFSLYEYYREIIGWVVLRNQIRYLYDPKVHAIKYHYFAYEAEHTNPVFVTGVGEPCCFDCHRTDFIGRGRSEANPIGVEKGMLSNSQLPGGGLGIGALAYQTTIPPGGKARFAWILGAAEKWDEADALARKYQSLDAVDQAYAEIRTRWEKVLGVMQTEVPDPEMQNLVNVWNPYGTVTTFFRDRDISSDLPGLNAGIRFRDGMQNCMSMCSLEPQTATDRIALILEYQRKDGSALDAFLPGSKVNPGNEQPRCDNAVWPPITAYSYLAESGDRAYLDKVPPFLGGGEGTVYEHLMNGLRQIARDVGKHGLPLLKGRDWDDHLAVFSLPGAESVMTAQNWCYAALLMKEICRAHGKPGDAEWLEQQHAKFSKALNEAAWDGEWYQQVLFPDDKIPLGSKRRRENKIYINTQAWAVISKTAPGERAALCLDKMREWLNTDYGIKFLVPPYTGIPEPEDPLVSNGPGLGENGGIFIQANCWAMMAEAILGRGDRAYEYYRQVMPPIISEKVGPDVYLNEPYMFSSHVITDPDPRKGMATLSWLTGTVNWMYIVATQFILGIRPTLTGLMVQPAIPKTWKGFRAVRQYRGATYDIQVKHSGKGGAAKVRVNGKGIEGNILPLLAKGEKAEVKVEV